MSAALPYPDARALAAGQMTVETYVRHLPCAACATIGRTTLAVGTAPQLPVALAARPCGINGCTEIAERCGAHLQDRIDVELRKAIAATPAAHVGSRGVADHELRGRAWSPKR